MATAAEIWLACTSSARVPKGSWSREPSSNRSLTDSFATNEMRRVVESTRGKMLVT